MYFSSSIQNDNNQRTYIFLAFSCGHNGTISRLPTNITSPGWPGNYSDHENCIWRLQSHGLQIEIVFHDFKLEERYDFVTV